LLGQTGYPSVGSTRATWGLALSTLGTVLGAIALAVGSLAVWGVLHAVPTFEKAPFEQSMIKSVAQTKGITLTSLECPPTPPAIQGSTFQCLATKATGIQEVLKVRVVDDKGDVTWTLGQ
jgi:Domain of unknown function (DUF4333)